MHFLSVWLGEFGLVCSEGLAAAVDGRGHAAHVGQPGVDGLPDRPWRGLGSHLHRLRLFHARKGFMLLLRCQNSKKRCAAFKLFISVAFDLLY